MKEEGKWFALLVVLGPGDSFSETKRFFGTARELQQFLFEASTLASRAVSDHALAQVVRKHGGTP